MSNKCSVDSCNNDIFCKGYCHKHYKQMYKHGRILERTIYDANEFIIKDDCVEIVLYDKECKEVGRTIIDLEDYDLVKDYKWTLDGSGYAINRVGGIRLHRFVMNASDEFNIDHINGNRLDNRKCNLREVTQQQNCFNLTNRGQGNNKRKGVSYRKDRNKWRAYIVVDNKQISLGSFDTEEEAIEARIEAEIKYFGEYRRKSDW